MKIQYISCHSILEYDEVKLLTDIGHEVYSNGSYRDPKGAYTLPRPGIPKAPFDPKFLELTANHPKTDLPKELIDPYDAFIFMSGMHDQPLISNWNRIKHKRVILRTIGQSEPTTENMLKRMRAEGLQIVRYSPKEKLIPGYIGEDTMIRFYKDPEEFKGWTGEDKRPVNFTQSLKGRRQACHFDEIMGALVGFEGAKIYGSGNDDLGSFNGGEIPYEQMKMVMRNARVFVYTGTYPAAYTLSFIEALMTGMPIVAAGKGITQGGNFSGFEFYEVDEIIKNGVNGFVCNSIPEMRLAIEQLLADYALAQRISENARKTALELFDRIKIAQQWRDFLG